MNNSEFDHLLNTVRNAKADPQVVSAAAARVYERLQAAAAEQRSSSVNRLCGDFRKDFDAYRSGAVSLGEGRRMLLEDHLSSCALCRAEFAGEKLASLASKAPVIVMRKPAHRVAFRRVVMIAAAAAITVGLGLALPPVLDRALAPSGSRGTVASVAGSLVLVSSEGTQALPVGADIDEGQEIRTGRDSHALIRLRDGSTIEMAERSDLNLTERWLGKTVHLTRGSVMVEAAKQRRGRLEVATADFLISVKGTIFGVSRGLKGSRVSVVEGEVQVDQHADQNADHSDATQLLHRGEQSVSHPSMARTAVETDIAWSQNAAKYLTLLADMNVISGKIAAIPMPGLRYSSTLLDRVPTTAVVVASIPNLSNVLGEATKIFDDRARESASLAEWWNSAGSQQMRDAVEKIRGMSEFLGDEIIIAIEPHNPPLILAEARRPGLADYLVQNGYKGPMALDGSLVAIGVNAVPLPGSFSATDFGKRISESYRAGVGLLLAVNLEQISSNGVLTTSVATPTSTSTATSSSPANIAGFDNARFLIAERKTNLGLPDNTATLSFAGERHGLASWLATPAPIGSLEFISAQASFVAGLVARDPKTLLTEVLKMIGPQSEQGLQMFQAATGVDPIADIAGSLGGEATIAVDGAVLPFPDWKVAIEVDNSARLQKSIDLLMQRAAAAMVAQGGPTGQFGLSSEVVQGRTYYSLVLAQPAITIHYTYVDGYLLAGANRALLMTTISNRAAGLTLTKSAAFRAQLPLDGRGNFSGVLYYNFGAVVGPMADQLKATGLVSAEQQKQIDTLTANREPSIVYLYGEPDRITVGSRSELLSVGLRTLAGLASGHPTAGLPFFGLAVPSSQTPSTPVPKATQ